jgi:hypothetical protein
MSHAQGGFEGEIFANPVWLGAQEEFQSAELKAAGDSVGKPAAAAGIAGAKEMDVRIECGAWRWRGTLGRAGEEGGCRLQKSAPRNLCVPRCSSQDFLAVGF